MAVFSPPNHIIIV